MTINLIKNQLNIVMFTLNESITLENPSFILQIESKVDFSSKVMWLLNDVTLNSARYNEYIIEMVDKIDENLSNMKIYLEEGTYNFYVWQTDSIVLNTNNALNIIESGKLIVNASEIIIS